MENKSFNFLVLLSILFLFFSCNSMENIEEISYKELPNDVKNIFINNVGNAKNYPVCFDKNCKNCNVQSTNKGLLFFPLLKPKLEITFCENKYYIPIDKTALACFVKYKDSVYFPIENFVIIDADSKLKDNVDFKNLKYGKFFVK